MELLWLLKSGELRLTMLRRRGCFVCSERTFDVERDDLDSDRTKTRPSWPEFQVSRDQAFLILFNRLSFLRLCGFVANLSNSGWLDK